MGASFMQPRIEMEVGKSRTDYIDYVAQHSVPSERRVKMREWTLLKPRKLIKPGYDGRTQETCSVHTPLVRPSEHCIRKRISPFVEPK